MGTVIDNDYNVMINSKRYNVIWNSTDTMDGVQVYCKAIVIHLVRTDEAVNYQT